MDLSIVAKVCLDGRHDGPTAVGSVLKMLHDRIVILFPPSERLVAEKAFHTIGAPVERVEEEAGFRKLEGACRVSAGQSITTVGIEAHIDWRQPFVRPMQRLRSARARVGRPTFFSGGFRALKRRQAVLIGKVSVAASGHGHCRGHCRGATPADRGSGIGVREDAVAVARRRTGNVDSNAQNKQTMSKKNGDQKQCGIAGIVVYRSSQRVVLSETRDASLVEGKEWKPPPSQNTRRDSDWPPGRRVCLLSRTRLEMWLERCIALGGVAGGALQVSNAQFNVDISISTTVNRLPTDCQHFSSFHLCNCHLPDTCVSPLCPSAPGKSGITICNHGDSAEFSTISMQQSWQCCAAAASKRVEG